MKLTINRKRDSEGFNCTFELNEMCVSLFGSELYKLSRIVTGHTGKSGDYGIFNPYEFTNVEFHDLQKQFKFNKINYNSDSLSYIQTELKSRAKVVREWITSVSFEESTTFEI